MRLDVDGHDQVAGIATVRARLTLAANLEFLPILDACWHLQSDWLGMVVQVQLDGRTLDRIDKVNRLARGQVGTALRAAKTTEATHAAAGTTREAATE